MSKGSLPVGRQVLNKACVPCEGIGRALNPNEILEFIKSTPAWQLSSDQKSIFREFVLKNFVQCVDRINKIKDIAETQGHHPDIHLTGYKNLKVVLYTHAFDGLTQNDFILAVKMDQLDAPLGQ